MNIHVYLQAIIISREEDEVKVDNEDGAKRGSPIMVYGGVFRDVFIKHVLASTIKKGVST